MCLYVWDGAGVSINVPCSTYTRMYIIYMCGNMLMQIYVVITMHNDLN